MATKLVEINSPETETPFLVDSYSEAARSDLESECRALIFNFITMKDSETATSQTPSDFLLLPSKTKTSTSLCSPRGTTKPAETNTDQSEGDSVDLTDSSVDLVTMAEDMHVSGSEDSVRDLVPATLPVEYRDNLSKVEENDVKKLYDIQAGLQRVKNGDLSTVELIVLHWRSYRNIINYELSDVETLRSRFVRYFGSIFADLIEFCYPNRGPRQVNDILVQEFQQFNDRTCQPETQTVSHSSTTVLTPNGSTPP